MPPLPVACAGRVNADCSTAGTEFLPIGQKYPIFSCRAAGAGVRVSKFADQAVTQGGSSGGQDVVSG
jgi:hypothetical protein